MKLTQSFPPMLTDYVNDRQILFIATYVVEVGLRLEIDPQLSKFFSKAVHHNSVLNGRTNETEGIRDNGFFVFKTRDNAFRRND